MQMRLHTIKKVFERIDVMMTKRRIIIMKQRKDQTKEGERVEKEASKRRERKRKTIDRENSLTEYIQQKTGHAAGETLIERSKWLIFLVHLLVCCMPRQLTGLVRFHLHFHQRNALVCNDAKDERNKRERKTTLRSMRISQDHGERT